MTDKHRADEVQDPSDSYEAVDPNETAESDDSDVEQALERETDDGKGGAVVPKTNFQSYATDEVETEDDSKES